MKIGTKPTLTSALRRDIPKTKDYLKSQLPVLSYAEVRRFRVPLHEALLLELREEDLHSTANYLESLFDLDEKMRLIAGSDSLDWSRPRLKDNNKYLEQLVEVLRFGCDEKTSPSKRVEVLVAMALCFQKLTWEWWWVSQSLYQKSLVICRKIKNDEGRVSATLRYVYAKFLLHKKNDLNSSLIYAQESQNLSKEKIWTLNEIFTDKGEETIFRASSKLIYECLMRMINDTKLDKLETAIDLCKLALDTAISADLKNEVAEAFCKIGNCEELAGNQKSALIHFRKYLSTAIEIGDYNYSTDAHLRLAQFYEKLEEDERMVHHLEKCKNIAGEHNLISKLAQAHFAIGKHHLDRLKNFDEAVLNFERAFKLFSHTGLRDEAHRSRFMIGVSRGQKLAKPYQNLMMDVIYKKNEKSLLKLFLWKSDRKPFDF